MYCMYSMYCVYVYVLCVCVCISSNILRDTYTYIHIHTYIQYKQTMLQMYVCVCIFGLIHTSYIQLVLHTYTYKHAGFLMLCQPEQRRASHWQKSSHWRSLSPEPFRHGGASAGSCRRRWAAVGPPPVANRDVL
jgi:hypothetical protein